MSKQNSETAFIVLIVLGVIGAWLAGSFERAPGTKDISDASLLLKVCGCLIFLGSFIGIVYLIRNSKRPLSHGEWVQWAAIREQGKHRYLRKAILKGCGMGFIIVSWSLIDDYWKAKSISSRADSLWISAVLFLTIVFAAFYAATRTWNASESDYETMKGSTQQHNN